MSRSETITWGLPCNRKSRILLSCGSVEFRTASQLDYDFLNVVEVLRQFWQAWHHHISRNKDHSRLNLIDNGRVVKLGLVAVTFTVGDDMSRIWAATIPKCGKVVEGRPIMNTMNNDAFSVRAVPLAFQSTCLNWKPNFSLTSSTTFAATSPSGSAFGSSRKP